MAGDGRSWGGRASLAMGCGLTVGLAGALLGDVPPGVASATLLALALSFAGVVFAWLQARHGLAAERRAAAAREGRAAGALAEAQALAEALLEAAGDAWLLTDAAGHVRQCNPAARRLFGLPQTCPPHATLAGLLGRDTWTAIAAAGETAPDAWSRPLPAALPRPGGSLDVRTRWRGIAAGGQPAWLVHVAEVTPSGEVERRHAVVSRRVLAAQEDERARLSRELHDELGQILTAARIELGLVEKRTAAPNAEAARALGQTVRLVEHAAHELRRLCRGLRPLLLDDLGLVPAVQQLIDEFRTLTGIEAAVDVQWHEPPDGIPREAALCAYRILQESLTNVRRHARAKHVQVSLAARPRDILLSVYDDGVGFDLAEIEHSRGFGLIGMRERASLVGGTLDVRSARGEGTRIVFRAPFEALADEPRAPAGPVAAPASAEAPPTATL